MKLKQKIWRYGGGGIAHSYSYYRTPGGEEIFHGRDEMLNEDGTVMYRCIMKHDFQVGLTMADLDIL